MLLLTDIVPNFSEDDYSVGSRGSEGSSDRRKGENMDGDNEQG
jgi:hypothetical protein